MKYSVRRSLRWLAFCCSLFSAGLLLAQPLTVIGGTSLQRQLVACIEHVSAEDLDRLPDHSMTIVILEHERFLQVKGSFGAYRTKLAFSNLAMRRMYLSSAVFRDLDTVLRCIPHELGHFVTRSVYEDHAEIAAGAIRKRAREMCTMPIAPPVSPHKLSSQLKSLLKECKRKQGGEGNIGVPRWSPLFQGQRPTRFQIKNRTAPGWLRQELGRACSRSC